MQCSLFLQFFWSFGRIGILLFFLTLCCLVGPGLCSIGDTYLKLSPWARSSFPYFFCPCTAILANHTVDADWKLPWKKGQVDKLDFKIAAFPFILSFLRLMDGQSVLGVAKQEQASEPCQGTDQVNIQGSLSILRIIFKCFSYWLAFQKERLHWVQLFIIPTLYPIIEMATHTFFQSSNLYYYYYVCYYASASAQQYFRYLFSCITTVCIFTYFNDIISIVLFQSTPFLDYCFYLINR